MGFVPRAAFGRFQADHWEIDPRVRACTDRWVVPPVMPARCRVRPVCAHSVPIAPTNGHDDRSIVARVPTRARLPGRSTGCGSSSRPPLVDASTLRPLSRVFGLSGGEFEFMLSGPTSWSPCRPIERKSQPFAARRSLVGPGQTDVAVAALRFPTLVADC